MGVSESTRAWLEHRPRRVFRIDETRMAAVMTAVLARFYVFAGPDGRDPPLWWALRRDGQPAVSGATPDALRRAVLADFTDRLVRPR